MISYGLQNALCIEKKKTLQAFCLEGEKSLHHDMMVSSSYDFR